MAKIVKPIEVKIEEFEAEDVSIKEVKPEAVENKLISKCSNCKFYKEPSCCFNPPEWREYSKRYEFIKTSSHQWCGRWEDVKCR